MTASDESGRNIAAVLVRRGTTKRAHRTCGHDGGAARQRRRRSVLRSSFRGAESIGAALQPCAPLLRARRLQRALQLCPRVAHRDDRLRVGAGEHGSRQRGGSEHDGRARSHLGEGLLERARRRRKARERESRVAAAARASRAASRLRAGTVPCPSPVAGPGKSSDAARRPFASHAQPTSHRHSSHHVITAITAQPACARRRCDVAASWAPALRPQTQRPPAPAPCRSSGSLSNTAPCWQTP